MDKQQLTPDVVSCLVRTQVPWLAHERVTPVAVDGWDNSSFRVGQEHVARMPAADGYVPAVAKEHRWLPVLAPHLPVDVPEPVLRGEPGCGFPRPWSLYGWIPGDTAGGGVDDLSRFAVDVAAFLIALQGVDATGAPAAGGHSFGRGGPLSRYTRDVHDSLASLPEGVEADAVITVWEAAVARPHDGPPVWFHGDMAPSNLLVRNGRLSAVIDFGTCGVGDPACDLVLAWTYLDDEAAAVLRAGTGVDDETWSRGAGWALWKALLTVAEDDPAASERRYGWRYSAAQVIRRTVSAVLD